MNRLFLFSITTAKVIILKFLGSHMLLISIYNEIGCQVGYQIAG
jgi:hypothetical protein